MNTRKKIVIISAAIIAILITGTLSARTPVGNETFGVGIQLGDPTAVTMKVMPNEKFAFQFFLGAGNWYNDYYYYDGSMFITGIDFVGHPVMIYDGWKTCALNLTLGGGLALGLFKGWYYSSWNRDYRYDTRYYDDHYYGILFVRLVTGVNLWFKKIPLETFVEMSPALRFVNPDPFGFHMFWVAAGARWFF